MLGEASRRHHSVELLTQHRLYGQSNTLGQMEKVLVLEATGCARAISQRSLQPEVQPASQYCRDDTCEALS